MGGRGTGAPARASAGAPRPSHRRCRARCGVTRRREEWWEGKGRVPVTPLPLAPWPLPSAPLAPSLDPLPLSSTPFPFPRPPEPLSLDPLPHSLDPLPLPSTPAPSPRPPVPFSQPLAPFNSLNPLPSPRAPSPQTLYPLPSNLPLPTVRLSHLSAFSSMMSHRPSSRTISGLYCLRVSSASEQKSWGAVRGGGTGAGRGRAVAPLHCCTSRPSLPPLGPACVCLCALWSGAGGQACRRLLPARRGAHVEEAAGPCACLRVRCRRRCCRSGKETEAAAPPPPHPPCKAHACCAAL